MKALSTQVVENLANGDEKALNYIYKTYYPAVFATVRGIVLDQNIAAGLTNEAFFKLWVHREAARKCTSISSWLFSAAKNASIDFLRKEKRLSIRAQIATDLMKEHSPSWSACLSAQESDWLELSLAKLPPRCGRVLKAHYLEGKKYSEIAAEMGISTNTVRNQKERALRLMRNFLESKISQVR